MVICADSPGLNSAVQMPTVSGLNASSLEQISTDSERFTVGNVPVTERDKTPSCDKEERLTEVIK